MDTVFPHPTLSEMMHESVLAAYGQGAAHLAAGTDVNSYVGSEPLFFAHRGV